MGDRPTAGHTALDRGIGVRIPVSQRQTHKPLKPVGFVLLQSCLKISDSRVGSKSTILWCRLPAVDTVQ